jgi:hypothetical protein
LRFEPPDLDRFLMSHGELWAQRPGSGASNLRSVVPQEAPTCTCVGRFALRRAARLDPEQRPVSRRSNRWPGIVLRAKHNWPVGRKPVPHKGELEEIRDAVQSAFERMQLGPPKGWQFGPEAVAFNRGRTVRTAKSLGLRSSQMHARRWRAMACPNLPCRFSYLCWNLTNYQCTVQALDSGGKVLGTAQAVTKFPPWSRAELSEKPE